MHRRPTTHVGTARSGDDDDDDDDEILEDIIPYFVIITLQKIKFKQNANPVFDFSGWRTAAVGPDTIGRKFGAPTTSQYKYTWCFGAGQA